MLKRRGIAGPNRELTPKSGNDNNLLTIAMQLPLSTISDTTSMASTSMQQPTGDDESAEATPDSENQESEGTVDISEEFQRSASTLLDGATTAELDYLASKAQKMCYEQREAERAKSEPVMSDEGMPTD